MPFPSPRRAARRSGICLLALVISTVVSAQSASGLVLQPGYKSAIYAGPFPDLVTSMTQDPQGHVYVGMIGGCIHRLTDYNQDGIVDSTNVFFTSGGTFSSLTDILWIGTKLYASHLGTVSTLEDTNNDGVADVVATIVTNLPIGFHQNNGLLQDGPNHLLICSGSCTDIGPETNPISAAILRCGLDGSNLTVWATGVRNTFRLARHPATGEVFGGDNEWNSHPSLPLKGDEINRIQPGADYGFPTCFGIPPAGSTSQPPTVQFPPHVAPVGMAFNPNTMISGYRNELYVALFPRPYINAVVRVPIWYGPRTGNPVGVYDGFALAFQNPIDVEFLPDGSMLVADFTAKVIHRITPISDAIVTVDGVPEIGGTFPIQLKSASHPFATIIMGASHAGGPPLPLTPQLNLYLEASSPLLPFSLTPNNGIFQFPAPGQLDANGEATATVSIPNVPSLIGSQFFVAFVVFGPNMTMLESSPEQRILIVPQF